MDLSFSGAGFMGCYYFGVVDCWNKYIPKDRINRVAGASAGSLIAAYYLMDLPLKGCLREIISLTEGIRSRALGVFDRSHQIVDLLPEVLDRLFPDDAHKRVSGRLFVCMTRLKDMKKVVVSQFESKKDLIDALNCSCFIPVWSGNHVSTFRGVKHIDGGFSDNLPIFDDNTIRICCFAGPTDISPYDRVKSDLFSSSISNMPIYFNFANCRRGRRALFPPPASYILDILQRGFHDTKQFILDNDLIQCNSCYKRQAGLGPRSLITSTISPRATPSVSRQPSIRAPIQTRTSTGQRVCGSAGSSNCGSPSDSSSASEEIQSRESAAVAEARTFSRLLSEKLRRSQLATEHVQEAGPPQQMDSTRVTPTIVVTNEEISDINNNSLGDQGFTSRKFMRKESAPFVGGRPSLARGPPALRRNTLAFGMDEAEGGAFGGGGSLLVMRDKFTLAPNPLPSCPPSPSLNRHCVECIRLRQEARNDLLEEAIRMEVEKYYTPPSAMESKLKSRLASPIRWFRQLGTKSSYRLHDRPQ